MNFGDALQMLKEGQDIRRFNWQNEERLSYSQIHPINHDTQKRETKVIILKGINGVASWIPWEPTLIDILAEDWMVVG